MKVEHFTSSCGCWWFKRDNMVIAGSVCNDCLSSAGRALTGTCPQYRLDIPSHEAHNGDQVSNPRVSEADDPTSGSRGEVEGIPF